MEKQILEQMKAGIEEQLKKLSANRDIFLKFEGIDERIKATQIAQSELEVTLSALKEELKVLEEKKTIMMESTAKKIKSGLDEVLPEGSSYCIIPSADELKIGWIIGDNPVEYGALSGGQKVAFNAALSHVMVGNGGILIIEAAELDNEKLQDLILQLDALNCQVILSSCHIEKIKEDYNILIPVNWKMIEVKT